MDIMKIATQLVMKQFSGDVSESNATDAITSLLGDGQGGLDIGSIVSKMSSSDMLSGLVGSWLGDGGNQDIGAGQIAEVFGQEKLAKFSGLLGVGEQDAASGLSAILPKLIDQSSSGGSLLDSVGGLGGAMSFAKKLF